MHDLPNTLDRHARLSVAPMMDWSDFYEITAC